MSSHYPPYGGNASEASFDHVARGADDYTNSTTNLAGAEKSGALGAGGFKGKMASQNGGRNNTKKWIIAGVVAGVVVIGAVLGGVLGTQLNKDTSTSSSSNGIAANDAAIKVVAASTSTAKDGSVKTVSSTSTSTSAPSSTSSAAAVASVSPLPEWKWTQSAFAAAASSGQGEPMWGAALGNWLILEQWMDEPWFNATSGKSDGSVRDEWTLMQVLGDNARSAMTAHYDSWFTEDDMERLHQAGMNHVRIPAGFWAFIDCVEGEPYLCNFNQTDYIERALGWAYDRGMYAIIDIHGLPGSHNGEVTSGHLTTNPTFFQDANQQRSKDTVKAALSFITNSPYRSVVSALQIINEPRPYTQGQFDMLRDYYQDAYDQSTALANPVPIIFHHGYPDAVLHTPYTTYWHDFVANKDPSLIAMSTHPYIGTFPLSSNQEYMLNAVCTTVTSLSKFPVPILVTEWSIQTGVKTPAFEKQLFTSELVNFAMIGGSIFWNFKAVNGNVNQGDNSQWSFLDLLGRGSVPSPSNGQSHVQFLQSLGQPCGNGMTQVSWASSSGGSAASTKIKRKRHHR